MTLAELTALAADVQDMDEVLSGWIDDLTADADLWAYLHDARSRVRPLGRRVANMLAVAEYEATRQQGEREAEA